MQTINWLYISEAATTGAAWVLEDDTRAAGVGIDDSRPVPVELKWATGYSCDNTDGCVFNVTVSPTPATPPDGQTYRYIWTRDGAALLDANGQTITTGSAAILVPCGNVWTIRVTIELVDGSNAVVCSSYEEHTLDCSDCTPTGEYVFGKAFWPPEEPPTSLQILEAEYEEFDSADLEDETTFLSEEMFEAPGYYAFKVWQKCGETIIAISSPSSVISIAPVPECYDNQPPEASFFFTRASNVVTVNTSLSSDPDHGKNLLARHIDWGDGAETFINGLTTNAMHTYQAAGTYTITVTITDPCMAADSLSDIVTIPSIPTWPPDGPPDEPEEPSDPSSDPPGYGLTCPVPSLVEHTTPCGLNISEAMEAHLAQSPTTLCACWRVERRDGVVFGFTSHVRDLFINTGRGEELYRGSLGMTPSGVSVTENLTVDNMEVMAVLEDDAITDRDLAAGLFDDAEVEIFLVNYADLSMGRIMGTVGYLGRVTRKEKNFVAEHRALSQKLNQNILPVTSELCRVKSLGDSKCKVDLNGNTIDGYKIRAQGWVTAATSRSEFASNFSASAPPPYQASTLYVWNTVEFTSGKNEDKTFSLISFDGNKAVVFEDAFNEVKKIRSGDEGILHATRISDSQAVDFPFEAIDTINNGQEKSFVVKSSFWGSVPPANDQTFPEAHFATGTVRFTSGLNYGIAREVKAFGSSGFSMAEAFPFNIEPGDHFVATAGCDKRIQTCIGKYNNAINFQGEPHVPGIEKALEVNKGDD